MAPIDEALAALESLKLGDDFCYSQIAEKYGVDRSTLSRRHRGLTRSLEEKHENTRLLNNAQEKELIKHINNLCERGLAPSKQAIRDFASHIAHKDVGQNWVNRFIHRHHEKLETQWVTGLDRQRFNADSYDRYERYFLNLSKAIEKYRIEPRHIYNMDEKGFMIGIGEKIKRVFTKDSFYNKKMRRILQDGNREWITTIACICADGTALSPFLIYQAASGKVQDSWLQDFDPQQHQAYFTSSPTGWTNNELGLKWLSIFDRETKAKTRTSWRLLVLDGHGSHLTSEFLNFCDSHKILLSQLPAHSTHTLQPLDVALFAPLAAGYRRELSAFFDDNQGLTSLTKRDFYRLFDVAWRSSFVEKNILRGFEATGISPLNPDVVLHKFKPASKSCDRPPSSDSNSSNISQKDWRAIRKLLREAMVEQNDILLQRLERSLHGITTQNEILKHQLQQSNRALINEKKRRQRGKPLELRAPHQNSGEGVVWSPCKVADNRQLNQEKEQQQKEQEQKKAEAARARTQRKALQEEEAQQKRIERLAAKEKREAEKRQKVMDRQAAKEAQQAEKQLQKEIQLSKTGKAQSLKLQALETVVVDGDEPIGVEEAIHSASRSGRPIKRPQRFLT